MIFKGEKLYGFSHYSGAKASSKPAFRGSALAPFLHSLRSFRNGFAAPTIRRKHCCPDAAGGPHWYAWCAVLRVTSGDCAGVARKLLYQHALACCKSGASVVVRTQLVVRIGTLGAQFCVLLPGIAPVLQGNYCISTLLRAVNPARELPSPRNLCSAQERLVRSFLTSTPILQSADL